MADLINCVDDLLSRFDHDLVVEPKPNTNTNIEPPNQSHDSSNTLNNTPHSTHSVKHQNGKITDSSSYPIHSEDDVVHRKTKGKDRDDTTPDVDDDKEDFDNDFDELSEEEALRMAMEMSMTDEDRQLAASIEKEIRECQGHLSRWFAGSFKCVRDKNMAWCDFCKRLHHQFVMYRIEQGIIQPLSYQFFIQFIAMLYGSASANAFGSAMDLSIDQHKIKNIEILSADNVAISYLRFKQGMAQADLKNAVYAKFASLALDPMSPNEWKANHVMFIQSEKAPNGLLWTKWHMQ